jgi:hypothetical protein
MDYMVEQVIILRTITLGMSYGFDLRPQGPFIGILSAEIFPVVPMSHGDDMRSVVTKITAKLAPSVLLINADVAGTILMCHIGLAPAVPVTGITTLMWTMVQHCSRDQML